MKTTKYFILILFILTFKFGQSQILDTLSIIPNPISTTATIHFDIANNDTVTLSIYDLLGRNVRTYFNNTLLPSGSYSIAFFRDTLRNGMYLVQFQFGTHKQKNLRIIIESPAAGISQMAIQANKIIYPNPTSDMLTISIDGMKTILVTNLLGQICRSFKTESKSISVSDLTSGSYIINVFNQDDELLTTQKFIKDK